MVSDEIIIVLFGVNYLPSSKVLKILAPIILVISTCSILGQVVLIAVNKEKFQLVAMICGSIVNIILNYFMIPVYGINGAAIASLISETIVMFIFIHHSKEFFKPTISPRFCLTLLIACVFLIFEVKFIKSLKLATLSSLILEVIGGALCYGIVLIIGKNPRLISIFRNDKSD